MHTPQDKDMDHKTLLIKYIRHVGNAEGIDFITEGGLHSGVDFTPEEWAELKALAVAAREDPKPPDTE